MILLIFLLNNTFQFGAVFLAISPGSAQVGMGLGGVAYPNDIPGVYYNPANINLANSGIYVQNPLMLSPWNELFTKFAEPFYTKKPISYSPDWLPGLYPGMKYTYGGIKFPSYKNLSFGINYTFITTGETEASLDGNLYKWYTYDYAIGTTIGISFFDKMLNMGITLKYVYSFLVPEEVMEELGRIYGETNAKGSGYAFSFDAGILLKDPTGFSSFGVSYSNISGSMSYGEDHFAEDPLPRVIRFGYSLSPYAFIDYLLKENFDFPYDLTKFLEVRYSEDILTDRIGIEHDFWHSKGWEYTFFNSIYFRKGEFSDQRGGRVGKTEGFGLRLGNMKLDYADDSDIYDFYTENSRVSLSMDLIEGDNKYFAFPLSYMFPGAGHLYLGEAKKGLLYGGAAAILSLLYPMGDSRKEGINSALFYSLSAISIADLLISL